MIEPIVINRAVIKCGAGAPTMDYAQLIYKGEEIGFIDSEGIYLKMWHDKIKTGVFQRVSIPNGRTVYQLCQFVEKNWNAIYDRYSTVVRGK